MISKDIQKILINKNCKDILVSTDFLVEVMEKFEVLELLNKLCDFTICNDTLNIFPKNEEIDYGEYATIHISKEEAKVLKEWLENGK